MAKRIAIVVTLLVTTLLTALILRGVKAPATAGSVSVDAAKPSEDVPTTAADTTTTTSTTSTTTSTPTSTTSTTTSTTSAQPNCGSESAAKSTDPYCYPAPPAALWATGTSPEALVIGGAGSTIGLPIHVAGGLVIRGAGQQVVGGVSYGGSVQVKGANHRLKPPVSRDKTGKLPQYLHAADFTADSMLALNPRIVSEKSCADGTWFVSVDKLTTNTIYLVACDVQVSGTGTKNVGIVSSGSIKVSGAGIKLDRPFADSNATNSLTAVGPITISGASVEVNGLIVSDASVSIGGAGTSVCGGVYAPSIEIGGANFAAKPCDLG
jgi:hypothetical protein